MFEEYKELMKAKKWDEAVRCCDEILISTPDNKDALIKKGVALVNKKEWDRGIEILDAVLPSSSIETVAWYKLAEALIKRDGRVAREKARYCLDQGITNETKNKDMLPRLLESQLSAFRARKSILEFLQENLKEIRARADSVFVEHSEEKVFMYWGQGLDQAPALVKRCVQQARKLHGDKLVFLDSTTVPFYVDIPRNTVEKSSYKPAFFSDVLRVNLLARFGGVWLDATCFATQNLLEKKRDLAPSGFFAFSITGARISNWFLISEPGNRITCMMQAALDIYWEKFDRELEYFFFHHILEIICMLDEECNQVWENGVRLNNKPPLTLIKRMMELNNDHIYDNLISTCFVHKLTYKYEISDNNSRTILSKIIRG